MVSQGESLKIFQSPTAYITLSQATCCPRAAVERTSFRQWAHSGLAVHNGDVWFAYRICCIIHRRLLDSLPHHAGSGGEAHVLPGIGCGSVWRCRPFGSLELLPHCERLVGGEIIAVRMCVICLSVYGYCKLFLPCDYFCMYAFVAAKLIQKKLLVK